VRTKRRSPNPTLRTHRCALADRGLIDAEAISALNEAPSDASEFVLSRVYGQGWNAAKKLMAAESKAALALQLQALNPYDPGAESTRWASGFIDALDSRHVRPSITTRMDPWRPRMKARPPQ